MTPSARTTPGAAGARRPRLLRPGAADPHARATPPQRDLDTVVDAPTRWVERAMRAGPVRDRAWRIRGYTWGTDGDAPPRSAASTVDEDSPPRRIPVVLLHGLVVGARMCVPTARRLAPDGPVLVPDLPGSGRSSKPEPVPTIAELGSAVAALLRERRLPPAVLVGNSLGTQIAVHAARTSPAAVAGLVLASPTIDRRRRRWRKQIWRWQVEQGTQSLRLRAIQFTDYAAAGPTRAVRTFASALQDRLEAHLPHVDVPVLACLGGRDPLLTRKWVREVADAAPRGGFAFLPGAVHAMSHDNPLELARVVNGFVDELPG